MITAALIVFIFGRPIIDKLRVRQGKGQPIRADGPQTHFKKAGTPTMGGLMILAAIVVSTLIWANLSSGYVWVVLMVTLGFGAIGFYDDYLKVTKQSHLVFPERRASALRSSSQYRCLRHCPDRNGTVFHIADISIPEGTADRSWMVLHPVRRLRDCRGGQCRELTDGLDGLAIMPVMIAAASFGVIAIFRAMRFLPTICRFIS